MKKIGQNDLGVIYTILARVLAPDLGKRVTNRNGKCVVLIEHQLDAERFRVRIARNWEQLQTDEHAFISVLSKTQLVAAHATRLGCTDVSNLVQVAPASILPPDLRLLYSSAGLCYYLPVGKPDLCGQQEVTVAALPERLRTFGQGRIGMLTLSEEQRQLSLAYTRELQALAICDLRELLLARCSEIAPIQHSDEHQSDLGQESMPAQCEQVLSASPPQPIPLKKLEKIFVPFRQAAKAAKSIIEDRYTMVRWRERMWLRACLFTLAGGNSQALHQYQELDWHIRCVLVAHLYRQDLPRLVEVEPVYCQSEIIGYDILVSTVNALAA